MRSHNPLSLGAVVALASMPPDLFPRRAIINTSVTPVEEYQEDPAAISIGPGWAWEDPPIDTSYRWPDAYTVHREWEPPFRAGIRQSLSGAERARRKTKRKQAGKSRRRNRQQP